MTHNDLMKQSGETYLKWLADRNLRIEECPYHSDDYADVEWYKCSSEPDWDIGNCYYRIAETVEPEPPAISASDFPLDKLTWLKHVHDKQNTWLVDGISDTSVHVCGHWRSYSEIAEHWLWFVNGEWVPCRKEAT